MRRIFGFLLTIGMLTTACNKSDDTKDMTYPVISNEGIKAVPSDCQEFLRGGTIHFCYVFSDDTELGSYNIEIHNNFDHHTHGTSSVECDIDDKKDPISPWIYNQDFSIPTGTSSYTAQIEIPVPSDVDAGDYHFMIRLTDKAGWQQLKAMAIKIK